MTQSNSYTALQARFKPLFAQIGEGAVAREQQRELAFEAVALLRDAGFTALRVPQAHGGAGISLPVLFGLLIDLAEADSNLPQIVRAHFGFVEGRLSAREPASQDYWFAKVVAGQLWGAAMAERSDSTGNTACAAVPHPLAGNQPKRTENTATATMPTTKLGTAMPNCVSPDSTALFRRASQIPTGSAMANDSAIAATANTSETPARCQIIGPRSAPLASDTPKSPRSIAAIQPTY